MKSELMLKVKPSPREVAKALRHLADRPEACADADGYCLVVKGFLVGGVEGAMRGQEKPWSPAALRAKAREIEQGTKSMKQQIIFPLPSSGPTTIDEAWVLIPRRHWWQFWRRPRMERVRIDPPLAVNLTPITLASSVLASFVIDVCSVPGFGRVTINRQPDGLWIVEE